nr:hypothetical protein [Actinomyces sp. 565]
MAVKGAVELNLVSRSVPAQIEVVGTTRAPKYLGAARGAVAFPAQAVAEDAPTTVRVMTASGDPFPGDYTVDLAIGVVGGQSYLLRSVPVSGRSVVAVLSVTRAGSTITVRPGEGGTVTLGLGGWCARRWEEQGHRLHPSVTSLVIDTSASMQQYQDRVDALLRFLDDLYGTVGVPAPTVRRVSVGGAESHGVGQVAAPDDDAGARVAVVTDLPPEPARSDVLLAGPTEVLSVLPAPEALALDGAAWAELMREDLGFGPRTLELLAPLLTWLSTPAGHHGNGENV